MCLFGVVGEKLTVGWRWEVAWLNFSPEKSYRAYRYRLSAAVR